MDCGRNLKKKYNEEFAAQICNVLEIIMTRHCYFQVTSVDFAIFSKTYSDPCFIIIIAPNRAVTTQPPSR